MKKSMVKRVSRVALVGSARGGTHSGARGLRQGGKVVRGGPHKDPQRRILRSNLGEAVALQPYLVFVYKNIHTSMLGFRKRTISCYILPLHTIRGVVPATAATFHS